MEVKPCPHCGSEVDIVEIPPHKHMFVKSPDHPGSWYIECSCGAGMIDESREKLIERWNRRAEPSESELLREEKAAKFDVVVGVAKDEKILACDAVTVAEFVNRTRKQKDSGRP